MLMGSGSNVAENEGDEEMAAASDPSAVTLATSLLQRRRAPAPKKRQESRRLIGMPAKMRWLKKKRFPALSKARRERALTTTKNTTS